MIENKEKMKNINFEIPLKEYQRLRNLKEDAGLNWYHFLCDEKLDIAKRR